jgi:stage II sporulation protein D
MVAALAPLTMLPLRPHHVVRFAAAVGASVAAAALPAPSHAATTVVAKGAGFGHGIGMSQYGAYGQAKAGRSAAQILSTYYLGTALSTVATTRQIRVLLRTGSRVQLRGASQLAGSTRTLSPTTAYVLQRAGRTVTLSTVAGKQIASASDVIRLVAPPGGSIAVDGRALNGITGGQYRGAVELRGDMVINQLSLDEYVRGVVAGESPASWPAAALQAQAIAARSYAVTTSRSAEFDQYPDTRSQVYRGVTGETATTDAAVAATAGQLVTYNGTPITTFFFSTSGGQTENIENSFLGAAPKPYLRSVSDPWDAASPKHRWQIRYTRASLQKKLGSWVKGTLRSIDVIKRGASPRVVRADIVGSRGRTTVTGPALRTRLGLSDTWVQFVFNGASMAPSAKTPSTRAPTPTSTPKAPGTGGAALAASNAFGSSVLAHVVARPRGYAVATGRVWPDGGGSIVRLQVRRAGRWRTAIRVRSDDAGSWTAVLPVGSKYRVAALGVPGPVLTVR